jgi:nucleotidyltransferase/DNA polymerase involved in DNA repair
VSRTLLYGDVPDFYAEAERAARAALAGRPVIVGGDPRKRGLVQAATADARAAGVAIGMPVVEALERCPRARALRTDMARYRELDKRLRAVWTRVVERLEPAGLGAAYLEPPEGVPVEEVGARLREAVRRELLLPLRVGSGPVKFVARLAAEEAGPDGFLAVGPGQISGFLHALPVARLPGVGPNTAARLADLHVRTAGELVALGRAAAERALGNHGVAVFAAACGQGDDRIRTAAHPQSLSQEATLAEETLDRATLGEQVRLLSERLERALGLEGLVTRRLSLKVRYGDGEQITRTVSVERGLAGAGEIGELALELLGRTQAGTRSVRLLGLGASRLLRPQRDDRQLPLFRDPG